MRTPTQLVLLLSLLFAPFGAATLRADDRPNVLFIAVDDWNDWVGCLGHPQAVTPHVDRLAARGTLFTNAHCAAPVCNPSRVAVMTGLRPDTTGVYENNHVMRKKAPDVVTLPEHFRANGYRAVGGGKIYHDVPGFHDPRGFDDYFWWHPDGPRGGLRGGHRVSPYSNPPDPEPPGRPTRRITPLTKRNFDWGPVDGPEEDWPDRKVADWAGDFLTQDQQQPFFLAVGIFRPHVPWFNPRKYTELYPLKEISLPAVRDDDLDDLSTWARRRAADGNSRHAKVVEFGEWRGAVQAYLASISHADANVGRVLDALDRGPHRDDTIVVLWSDHGYHLGEKQHWHKRTLWERATRVPLVICVPPGLESGARPGRCARPVNLLDLYPTLVELCGLPAREQLEGESLVPLLKDSGGTRERPSITTYLPGNYAVRGEHHRYIRYADGSEELYDHRSDPHEWENVAARPDFARAKEALARWLPPARPTGDAPKQAASAPSRKSAPAAKTAASGADRALNVLLITSEDNGPELGCYGDPNVQTPHLDRLAADGVRFENAFVTHAVCSSSRSSIFTGLYPHQNGQIGLATHKFRMFRDWPNIPSILKANGYRTGIIGKLHVNPESAFPFQFKAFSGSNFGDRPMRKFADRAAEFIGASGEPFFLMVNYPDAHFPVLRQSHGLPNSPLSAADVKPMPWIGADSPRLRTDVANYYNCLMRLDAGVGMLLEELRSSGQAENTLVIYLGDHGAQFSRGKVTCYESGLRVPFIVDWPGVTKKGLVRDELVSAIDILPTILDATGLDSDGAAPGNLPGRSLRPLLGAGTPAWRQHLFAERTSDYARCHFPQRSVRDGRYKLITTLLDDRPDPGAVFYGDVRQGHYVAGTTKEELATAPPHVQKAYAMWRQPPPVQLYDLAEDPHEWHNLAGDPQVAKVEKRLRAELAAWQRRTADAIADPALLRKLTEENDQVARLPGARFSRKNAKQQWRYVDYLAPSVAAETNGRPSAPRDAPAVEEDSPQFKTVFTRRTEGYGGFRIPALVTAANGDLLAICEGRETLADHAENDIVMRRSADGGQTWSKLEVIREEGGDSLNDPCAVVLKSGRILLLYQRFPQGYHSRDHGKIRRAAEGYGEKSTRTYLLTSDDHGRTWSEPRNVTRQLRRENVIHIGSPGRAIELQRGPHAGRIVVPFYQNHHRGEGKHDWDVFAGYSDDGGKTWHRGQPAPEERPGYGNEAQLVELADGSVLLSARNQSGNGRRKTAVSRDGGQTWSPLGEHDSLVTPACMASVVRLDVPAADQPGTLLHVLPHGKSRKNGTLFVSRDDGQSWTKARVLYPDGFAYSCLTVLADGTIGCLFEADGYKRIEFARFDPDWLAQGTPP